MSTGPVTSLHYAPNANTADGSYDAAGDPGSDGFNLADVSSVAAANALPTGAEGLVWVGSAAGLTKSFEKAVKAAAGDHKVFGFYVADEAPDSAIPTIAAEDAYIAQYAPGTLSFIVGTNDGTALAPVYDETPTNTGADLIGLAAYPVASNLPGGFDLQVIDAAVAAAEKAGWALSQIVPIYQAFGGYDGYVMPTAAQEQQILAEWAKLVPTPVFDYAYSWGQQSGDTSLSMSTALQAVFAAHNAPATTTPTTPALSAITESPATGELCAGKTVTLTLAFNEAVTVAGGTPTLTLNDGGTASYVSGSGTSALVFSATVAAGQSTAALAATAVNLNGATITDASGNTASLTLTGLTQAGPQIDTTTPTVTKVAESPATGEMCAGKTVTMTLTLSEAVTVAGGTPTLTLNDGGTASYVSGSGTSALMFSTTVAAGQSTAALAATAVNLNGAIVTDAAGNAANLTLTGMTQAGPQIDTTTPAVTAVTESPATGEMCAGKTVTMTLTLSEAVTVAGGTPTLTLNDGGSASYVSGSGTSALVFSTTVAAGQTAAALAATAVALNGATVTDAAGNAANLTLTGMTQAGPQIDATTPVVTAITDTPATGVLVTGKTVTLTLAFNEAVTVAGGTPTLTLNDGGAASYVSGSGTSSLVFSYTVPSGVDDSALTATAVNLNGATVTDSAGNAANLALTGISQAGPSIDATEPVPTAITESPATGVLGAGKTVTLTMTFNEAVTVTGGTPTLTLNDGGVATYVSGSGTSALVFSTTVAAGQNVAELTATAANLNGATVTDSAGNTTNLALTGLTQTGPQIDTSGPTLSAVTESPATGALDAGKTVSLTLTLSEAVTVAGGTPTLTLNDGGTASYVSGSGTSALVFSTTVAAGQTAAALAATAVNLNGATIDDAAGNAANLTLTGLTQAGPQIDTTAPALAAVTEAPSSGALDAGKTVTLTLTFSEAVTVAGGTPTLTLNDGGTASYVSGSGTSALVFSTTVAAGQSAAALAPTAVNLNGATIADAAGNEASLTLSGVITGPQIDTTTPKVTAIGESPATGALDAGKTVVLTLTLSEAVTVTGGTPTLTLNDGGTASYTGGSGSDSLTFSTTVAAGQNTTALAATAIVLSGATIADVAGNAASLSLTGLTQAGPQIDTTTPKFTAVTESPATGTMAAGSSVTLTLALNESVTVAGGTPTLTLNDGGTASYVSGSGTSALVFSTTVAAGQSATALAATTVNLNGATIDDVAGNAANLSLTGLTQAGPVISTGTTTLAGPVTPLHYSPGNNTTDGAFNAAGDPGSVGFNMADVGSASAADALPAGDVGLIWLGDTSGLNSAFESAVKAAANDPKVYGFYVADEPADSTVANLKAECDYIHANAPGKMAFIVAEDDGSPTSPIYAITPSNTDADLIGLDPYPVRPESYYPSEFPNGFNLSVIDDSVAEAQSLGWSLSQIVPVYQAFGGGGYTTYTLPTAAQETQILAEWAKLTPSPAFDYAYAWGQQNSDTSLSMSPSLQAVFAQHNAVV